MHYLIPLIIRFLFRIPLAIDMELESNEGYKKEKWEWYSNEYWFLKITHELSS